MEINTNGDGHQSIEALKAHLAINVTSVQQSIEFYRKLFGVEPSKVRTGYAKFDVQNPPLNFTLNENTFSNHGALSHMGIQVRSTKDVLATRQRQHLKDPRISGQHQIVTVPGQPERPLVAAQPRRDRLPVRPAGLPALRREVGEAPVP